MHSPGRNHDLHVIGKFLEPFPECSHHLPGIGPAFIETIQEEGDLTP